MWGRTLQLKILFENINVEDQFKLLYLSNVDVKTDFRKRKDNINVVR